MQNGHKIIDAMNETEIAIQIIESTKGPLKPNERQQVENIIHQNRNTETRNIEVHQLVNALNVNNLRALNSYNGGMHPKEEELPIPRALTKDEKALRYAALSPENREAIQLWEAMQSSNR